jgi:hypothetical protein
MRAHIDSIYLRFIRYSPESYSRLCRTKAPLAFYSCVVELSDCPKSEYFMEGEVYRRRYFSGI